MFECARRVLREQSSNASKNEARALRSVEMEPREAMEYEAGCRWCRQITRLVEKMRALEAMEKVVIWVMNLVI